MIEPTDEMREVAYALLPTTARGHVDIALGAVFAIVERDRPCAHPYRSASAGPGGSVVCDACGDFVVPPRGSR